MWAKQPRHRGAATGRPGLRGFYLLAAKLFTTGVPFVTSFWRNVVNSLGVIAWVSEASRSMAARTSGFAMASLTALLSRLTIAGGSPGGPESENQAVSTRSEEPSSAKVGTSGNSGRRWAVETASEISLHDQSYRRQTCGRIGSSESAEKMTPCEVIVVNSTPAVRAMMRQTKTIPIVFAMINDSVSTGLVTSVARQAN
jgi:hypothetical protein